MDFIRIPAHRDVLVGMDFFTTEVLTLKGLTTYYVLFFILWFAKTPADREINNLAWISTGNS
jgi:hypothetical protein